MKRIFTSVLSLAAVFAMSAQNEAVTKTLWENEAGVALSWSSACTVTAAELEGLKAGDVFSVTVDAVKDGVDTPKFGFATVSGVEFYPASFEMWGDNKPTEFPAVVKYIVPEDALDKIAAGFELKGDGVTLSKLELTLKPVVEIPEGQTVLFDDENAAMLSWSVVCNVPAINNLKAGDKIIVTVAERKEGVANPKFGFEQGENKLYPAVFEMWGEKTFPCEVEYTITASDAAWMKFGFEIKGDGIKITRVVFESVVPEELPEGQILLWQGESTEVSWSAAGPTVSENLGAEIKAGDIMNITVSSISHDTKDWPKVVCRCADGWGEIFTVDLTEYREDTNVALPMVKSVTVTENMLAALAKGFNFGGCGTSIEKVTLTQLGTPTAVRGIEAVAEGETAIYNMQGLRVRAALNELPAGLYIVNGKKVLVK